MGCAAGCCVCCVPCMIPQEPSSEGGMNLFLSRDVAPKLSNEFLRSCWRETGGNSRFAVSPESGLLSIDTSSLKISRTSLYVSTQYLAWVLRFASVITQQVKCVVRGESRNWANMSSSVLSSPMQTTKSTFLCFSRIFFTISPFPMPFGFTSMHFLLLTISMGNLHAMA